MRIFLPAAVHRLLVSDIGRAQPVMTRSLSTDNTSETCGPWHQANTSSCDHRYTSLHQQQKQNIFQLSICYITNNDYDIINITAVSSTVLHIYTTQKRSNVFYFYSAVSFITQNPLKQRVDVSVQTKILNFIQISQC